MFRIKAETTSSFVYDSIEFEQEEKMKIGEIIEMSDVCFGGKRKFIKHKFKVIECKEILMPVTQSATKLS